jgi:hypothetical protein
LTPCLALGTLRGAIVDPPEDTRVARANLLALLLLALAGDRP